MWCSRLDLTAERRERAWRRIERYGPDAISREVMNRITLQGVRPPMSKRASATRPPAAKKRQATRTSKPPRELKLFRVRNPDFYEKAVTAYSEKDASFALGTADI